MNPEKVLFLIPLFIVLVISVGMLISNTRDYYKSKRRLMYGYSSVSKAYVDSTEELLEAKIRILQENLEERLNKIEDAMKQDTYKKMQEHMKPECKCVCTCKG